MFEIDENDILKVQETEQGTYNSIQIDTNTEHLSQDEIAKMVKNEAKYVADDRAPFFLNSYRRINIIFHRLHTLIVGNSTNHRLLPSSVAVLPCG